MNGPHIQFFGAPGAVLQPGRRHPLTPASGWRYGPATTMTSRRTTDDFEVYLWGHHMDTAVAHCRKGQQVYVFGRFSGREHHRPENLNSDTRGPRPRRERQGVPLLPGGGGRPAGAGPGHQRGASRPGVLGRRDRSGSPARDGPAAPGHMTHGPAGWVIDPV